MMELKKLQCGNYQNNYQFKWEISVDAKNSVPKKDEGWLVYIVVK